MERQHMTRTELVEHIEEWGDEAENANRHEFAAALRDLIDKVPLLDVGQTFFGVVDFDELGDDRFALIEVVDG